ncbi:MAG: peptidase M42 [Planctomycetaceae bacterium]
MQDSDSRAPWRHPMPDGQFALLRQIIGAPSPIGLEGAMTFGVIEPAVRAFLPAGWAIHKFRGSASLVVDSAPDARDAFSVMLIGHADKIRLQVRSVGEDGKVWLNSDSFLPATLVGQEAILFSEDPAAPGEWRVLEGATIEAVGAVHFAEPDLREGRKGITAPMLYLELHTHGPDGMGQVEKLGIKAGDPVLLARKVRRGVAPDTFSGAYLDNGLGCFVVAEALRIAAEGGGLRNLRLLGAIAAYEEVGRLGSRVLAQEFRPDAVIAIDVAHDYKAAPGVADKRHTPNAMGQGFTLAAGAITSAWLNSFIARVAREQAIPMQWKVVGKDTGTDAMAAVLASIDAAAASIGFPIRNMHTASETGHTGDVLAAIHVLVASLRALDGMHGGTGARAADLREGHPRLDRARPIAPSGPV